MSATYEYPGIWRHRCDQCDVGEPVARIVSNSAKKGNRGDAVCQRCLEEANEEPTLDRGWRVEPYEYEIEEDIATDHCSQRLPAEQPELIHVLHLRREAV